MKPITILIGALGGDGGGVLCDWIIAAAHSQGLGVQATQIPGVAQRTGATTYYLEVMPGRGPREAVLALNPAIGEVDVALATELLEAGRMIFNGFVTPDRTTLIASTHRVLAIGERAAMGDGSFDVGRLLRAVKERSKAQILFDMEQTAEESGGVINAVLLGALAGSGKLPIPDARVRGGDPRGRQGGRHQSRGLRLRPRPCARRARAGGARASQAPDGGAGRRGPDRAGAHELPGREPRRRGGGHSPPRRLPGPPLCRAVSRSARTASTPRSCATSRAISRCACRSRT